MFGAVFSRQDYRRHCCKTNKIIDPWYAIIGIAEQLPGRNAAASRSPPEPYQGCGLSGKSSADRHLAIGCIQPLRGTQKLQLTRFLQPSVLFRRRHLRRTHCLPDAVRIAVRLINPIVLQSTDFCSVPERIEGRYRSEGIIRSSPRRLRSETSCLQISSVPLLISTPPSREPL
jgi:hypothetical protein